MQDDPVQSQNLNQVLSDSTTPLDDTPTAGPSQAPQDVVSSFRKEVGPISSEAIINKEPLIKPSEQEPNLNSEVQNAGVQVLSDQPKLTSDQKTAGVTYSKESTQVSTNPSSSIKLPMTAAEAEVDVKGDPSSSLTWLAKLVLVYLKKLGGSAKG